MSEPMFLVWSNEHGAWWAPGSRGYTLDYRAAGRYSHRSAEDIVERASRGGTRFVGEKYRVLPEVMVLAPEHRWDSGPPETWLVDSGVLSDMHFPPF